MQAECGCVEDFSRSLHLDARGVEGGSDALRGKRATRTRAVDYVTEADYFDAIFDVGHCDRDVVRDDHGRDSRTQTREILGDVGSESGDVPWHVFCRWSASRLDENDGENVGGAKAWTTNGRVVEVKGAEIAVERSVHAEGTR